jgi:hypothetical protein
MNDVGISNKGCVIGGLARLRPARAWIHEHGFPFLLLPTNFLNRVEEEE